MALNIEWDEGNWPKCGKHGVSKEEIEFVLRHQPLVLPDRYPVEMEQRFNAIGKNAEGRYIFLVFTNREKFGKKYYRPISARYMHQEEIDCYEKG